MLDASQIAARLDAATQDRRLLDHPFYKAWVAGELSTEDLRFYSTQYFRQVDAFPGYLTTLADGLPEGNPRTTVLENLSDEVDGDHRGLWLDFAAAVGASQDDVVDSAVEPETTRCVDSFAGGIAGRSSAFGLGMLYAYESQTPEVAKTKVEGLRSNYGIDGPGVAYFELHGEMDVEHSSELAEALAEVVTDEDSLADAEAGARAGAEAIYGLLDGVARVCAISC